MTTIHFEEDLKIDKTHFKDVYEFISYYIEKHPEILEEVKLALQK